MVKENLKIEGYDLTIEQRETLSDVRREEEKAFLVDLFKAIIADLRVLGFQRDIDVSIVEHKLGADPLSHVWCATLQPDSDADYPKMEISSTIITWNADCMMAPIHGKDFQGSGHIVISMPYIQPDGQNEKADLIADPAQSAIMKVACCNLMQWYTKLHQGYHITYSIS